MKKFLLFIAMLFLVLINIRMLGQPVFISDVSVNRILGNNVPVADCRLLTSIDIFGRQSTGYDGVKQELKSALASRRLNETSLQRVVDLIRIETKLVNLLLEGSRGHAVEDIVSLRTKVLYHCTPSEVFVYNKLLDLSTYDEVLEKDAQQFAMHVDLKDRHERRLFLRRLLDTLHYYHAVLRNMQYEMSINPHGGGHAIIANAIAAEGSVPVMFCPVEL